MRGLAIGLGLVLMAVPPALADEKPEDAAPQRVTVRLTEYRFDPARIELKTGQETELTLVNEGTVLHEFITEGLQDVTADAIVNGVIIGALGVAEIEIPAKPAVLRFTPEKPGSSA
jgi:uncharacterized cupredoxin-like copper-binding protein